jgi:hypothetical protein
MTVSSSGAGSFKTGGFIKKIGGVEFIKRWEFTFIISGYVFSKWCQ